MSYDSSSNSRARTFKFYLLPESEHKRSDSDVRQKSVFTLCDSRRKHHKKLLMVVQEEQCIAEVLEKLDLDTNDALIESRVRLENSIECDGDIHAGKIIFNPFHPLYFEIEINQIVHEETFQ